MEQPVKRRGRPPKARAPEVGGQPVSPPGHMTCQPTSEEQNPSVLTTETVEWALQELRKPHLPGDDRIGRHVGECVSITFEDNQEYRVENGVIVERVR